MPFAIAQTALTVPLLATLVWEYPQIAPNGLFQGSQHPQITVIPLEMGSEDPYFGAPKGPIYSDSP